MGKLLRATFVRAALVVFGVVLSLVLFEVILQIGALFTGAGANAPAGFLSMNRRRVVCLGDSNTYALYVGHDGAWAHFLEEGWNADATHRPIEVLNLGVSGMNSSVVRARFNQVLDTFTPDVVLVMIGANDYWTAPVPSQPDGTGSEGFVSLLWRLSRAFRFFYMLHRAAQNYTIEYDVQRPGTSDLGHSIVRYGGHEIDLTWTGKGRGPGTWMQGLKDNLRAIAATAEAARVELVLLTYPSEYRAYGNVNAFIRDIAAETHVPLIDLGQSFLAACPSQDCDDLFFYDRHPTVKGHQLAASIIRQQWEASGVR